MRPVTAVGTARFANVPFANVEALETRQFLDGTLIDGAFISVPPPETGPGPAVVTFGAPGTDIVVSIDVNPSPNATSPSKSTKGGVTIKEFVIVKTVDKASP